MKVMNRLVIVSLALLATVSAHQQCLYCKRADTNAGFLYSYDFCPDAEEPKCIKDFWNYIGKNFHCVGQAIPGWELDIDKDCEAEEVTGKCQDFVSNELVVGNPQKMSRIQLVDNGKCTFSVDASSVVGRVTISAESTLGVLYPGYAAGQPITVERGSIKYITIFNGSPYRGPVSFTLTFSSATNLMASIASVAFTMYQMM